MNLKEQHMVVKRYLKNYCIKSAFLIVIIFAFIMCVNNNKQSNQYEDGTIENSFLHTPFVAINVSYKHNVYRMVIEESSIDLLPQEMLSDKIYRYELYPMLRNDTLVVDSAAFNKLRMGRGSLVETQVSVDSVYGGKVENILSSFFSKNKVLVDTLSEEEQIYIIYLLFQHGVYLKVDCETGLLHIVN